MKGKYLLYAQILGLGEGENMEEYRQRINAEEQTRTITNSVKITQELLTTQIKKLDTDIREQISSKQAIDEEVSKVAAEQAKKKAGKVEYKTPLVQH